VGDEGQLPPVLDKPKFDDSESTTDMGITEAKGVARFAEFQDCVELTECVRQDPSEPLYRVWQSLRIGKCSKEQWRFLLTRRLSNLPVDEQALFDDSVCLFSTKDDARRYNEEQLIALNQSVARIQAMHTGNGAKQAKSDDMCGLQTVLELAVGAKIMLRMNLWVSQGLVNGTIGTIIAIIYRGNAGPPSLPEGVVVHVPLYNGPGYKGVAHHILVTPVEFTAILHFESITRTQLPMCLAWGITIHKSQGMTIGPGQPIPRYRVNLGKTEFSAGLTFVALSRAMDMGCFVFDPAPDFVRMQAVGNAKQLPNRLLELQRIERLSADTLLRYQHLAGTSLK
jgi:hypothetical protein